MKPEWRKLSQNHLEGRTSAFFCYGDGGADELDENGRPKILRHPEYYDPSEKTAPDRREQYAPLVWQCRYSGIEVPDRLWKYVEFGRGEKYSDNQAEDMVREAKVMRAFDAWTDAFAAFVSRKGKVPAGEYRAYGYRPPSHRRADLKLKWRELRMKLGKAPSGSSPRRQHELGLSRDATFRPAEGEGRKLRKAASTRAVPIRPRGQRR